MFELLLLAAALLGEKKKDDPPGLYIKPVYNADGSLKGWLVKPVRN